MLRGHRPGRGRHDMAKLAILLNIEARSGKEADVEALLLDALPLARAEAGTRGWYAFQSGPSKFGIFDTFDDAAGRHAHLEGEVARFLLEPPEDLQAAPTPVPNLEIGGASGRGRVGQLGS